MLFLGVYWMGREYADSLRKYMRYRYYHKYVRAGTKKAYEATKNRTQNVRAKAKVRTDKIKDRIKNKRIKK